MATLEAQIAFLMQQNVELLLQAPGQFQTKINHEERNSRANSRNNNPHGDHRQYSRPSKLQDSGANERRGSKDDDNDLNRKITNLERQCASMA
jgi:hypothetical protein